MDWCLEAQSYGSEFNGPLHSRDSVTIKQHIQQNSTGSIMSRFTADHPLLFEEGAVHATSLSEMCGHDCKFYGVVRHSGSEETKVMEVQVRILQVRL
jgi:hypothetical protein